MNSCQSRDAVVQKNTSWVSEMTELTVLYFLKNMTEGEASMLLSFLERKVFKFFHGFLFN